MHMSDVTKQSYKDNLWNYLYKGENLVQSYYIDNTGVLTLGVGLSVADAFGRLRNQAELNATSTDPINQTIISRVANVLKTKGDMSVQIGSMAAFKDSDFKTKLEEAGLVVSYERVGENKSAYAINITGVKQLDSSGKPVTDANGKPVVTDVSNLFTADQARKGMEAFIANNGLEKSIDTAFGVDANKLTDNQRAALVSVLYNRGPGIEKLSPFVAAVKANDEDALFLAFSKDRLNNPKRVMDDYLEFSDATKVYAALANAQVAYVTGADGSDIVMGFFATDGKDKSLYKYQGATDSDGNYEVKRYKLVADASTKTNKWVEVVEPGKVSSVYGGDASEALALLGAQDILVAGTGTSDGVPLGFASLVREMGAQATRLATWQSLLQDRFGADVLFVTRVDGSRILINADSEEIGRIESGSDGIRILAQDGTFSATVGSTTLANGQSATTTEIVHPLAKGMEAAKSKSIEFDGGAKIVNTTRADGHIEEYTYKSENGIQVQQSYKVVSYSEAERSEASGNVALAGLEFLQALRHHYDVAAAGSLIKLVNSAQIASNTQPVLGAVGTGLSGAISLLWARSTAWRMRACAAST
jgi:predicted small secreted protein